MIYHEYIAALEIQYFYCVKHSDVNTLMRVMKQIARSHEHQEKLGRLSVFDLRAVDFSSMTSSQFEAFIGRRIALGEGNIGNPCVILVRDMVSFGMIRMYGALADFRGLRQEDQMFVTTEMVEAVEWVQERRHFFSPEQIAGILALAETRALSQQALPVDR